MIKLFFYKLKYRYYLRHYKNLSYFSEAFLFHWWDRNGYNMMTDPWYIKAITFMFRNRHLDRLQRAFEEDCSTEKSQALKMMGVK